jgi:hypothetical protein
MRCGRLLPTARHESPGIQSSRLCLAALLTLEAELEQRTQHARESANCLNPRAGPPTTLQGTARKCASRYGEKIAALAGEYRVMRNQRRSESSALCGLEIEISAHSSSPTYATALTLVARYG